MKKLQSEKAKLEQVQGMDDEKNALNSKYEQVQKEYKSLIINEKAYKTSYEKALKNFENEKAKLQNSNKKLKEADREINIKRQELETKKNELNNQKKFVIKPMYSVGSRYDNDAFLTLYNNIKSTKIMCYLFPACFFIIGLFVTSTTMIRFSTEQRINVGIYKFLGYDLKHIVIKFLIYGLVPTIIGLLIGSIAGTYLLPRFIIPTLLVGFKIFKDIKLYFVPTYAIVIVSSFIITSIITILIVVYIQLNDKTINLLTGKTTTVVKRVIFEKTILWKKLSFSKKILFRNLFKYKGRMLMTILGIGSCTALIYFGISLHFAFSDITKYQYTKIKKYDAIVYFNYNVSKEKKEEYINKISNFADLYLVNTNEKKFKHKGLDYKIIHEYLIKGSDKQFFNFNLKEHESEISLKTSEILKKKKGDYIDLSDIYNEVERIKIDGVFQNYIAQYVYTKDLSKESNAVIVKFKNNNIDINKLLDKDVVFNIRTKHDTKEFFIKQINSLSIVIVLMIILGAMLATIVTYNLGNINIIERKRELSTLKVLGYTKLEMNLYIFREIIILALFSILIGLYLGRKLQLFFATQFVNSPIQLVMRLNYIPFVISFVLSLLIVIIVSIFLIFKINKINMVDALKVGD
ncbi:FtsX-like permease family protein [Sneathia sanguinegens]|uniref:FtsX-like permease family protein n=1 Tax=Sneathia sanguinegens TaxID=40543 RepID=UPI0035C67E07